MRRETVIAGASSQQLPLRLIELRMPYQSHRWQICVEASGRTSLASDRIDLFAPAQTALLQPRVSSWMLLFLRQFDADAPRQAGLGEQGFQAG